MAQPGPTMPSASSQPMDCPRASVVMYATPARSEKFGEGPLKTALTLKMGAACRSVMMVAWTSSPRIFPMSRVDLKYPALASSWTVHPLSVWAAEGALHPREISRMSQLVTSPGRKVASIDSRYVSASIQNLPLPRSGGKA